MTEKHLKDMEAKLGKWDLKKKEDAPKIPRDYKVPNFGGDHDISDSLASLAKAEKELNKKWVLDATATQQAADIHLEKENNGASDPNHGSGDGCVEYDFNGKPGKKCGAGPYTHDANGVPIANAQIKKSNAAAPASDPIHGTGDGCVHYKDDGSIGITCKEAQDKAKEKIVDYMPHNSRGLDRDVKDSIQHEKDASSSVGHTWNISKNSTASSQLPAKTAALATANDVRVSSDPVCGSGGCKKFDHPDHEPEFKMNYKVPDFGPDHDIAASHAHEAAASASIGHVWNPDKDDDGNWIVPTTTAVGTKVDLNMKDDPICLSTGCETRPANPYNDEAWKKIGYSPLDTPLEEDMQASLASNKQAIKETGKEWSILQTQTEVHTSAKTENKAKAKTETKAATKVKTAEKTAIKAKTESKQKTAVKAKAKTAAKQKVVQKAEVMTKEQTEALQELKSTTRLQTKQEKAAEFAEMREKMMNNWGFKS